MNIKVYSDDKPADRVFTVHLAHPETPRGLYDEWIELGVTNVTGYVPRGELRNAPALRREVKRLGLKDYEVRSIKRTG